MDTPDYSALEQLLDYTFKDKQLLRLALTSPSARNSKTAPADNDNQRLEFLGDAVLDLLSAEQLYSKYASEQEGMLTQLRSCLVSGKALAELGKSINLGDWLILSEEEEKINGRNNNKHITDSFEAIFGAIWCDGSLPAVRHVYEHLNIGVAGDAAAIVSASNPKGELQCYCARKRLGANPAYETLPSPEPNTHAVRVTIPGGLSAEGTGRSKRQAEAAAAQALLKIISNV